MRKDAHSLSPVAGKSKPDGVPGRKGPDRVPVKTPCTDFSLKGVECLSIKSRTSPEKEPYVTDLKLGTCTCPRGSFRQGASDCAHQTDGSMIYRSALEGKFNADLWERVRLMDADTANDFVASWNMLLEDMAKLSGEVPPEELEDFLDPFADA